MTSLTNIPPACSEAVDYANCIILGEIDACELVISAAERFFRDMKNPKFYMDYVAAERVMRFVQMMPHIKGPDAGTNIYLAPWQKFIYLNIFGWKRVDTKSRRFRSAYNEIPRGNGKSTMVAPAGLYMLSADGEGGAEVYSAAVTRDQARIVFNAARAMGQRRSAFLKRAGVGVYSNSISQDKTSSLFQPLSADARTLDGLNVHLAILDELAQHKTREVYDVIETGTGKRLQPLMWMITTAGPDQGGIGYEIHDYAEKILRGVMNDDSFFALIYTVDPGDDWTSESSWKKANPNWGFSVQPVTINQLAEKAQQVPSFQNSFKMKHLNIWTNASVAWLSTTAWDKQKIKLIEEEFLGEECMIGLDLASKVDIAALIKIFRRPANSPGRYNYYIIPTLYIPQNSIAERRHGNYDGWVASGELIATPGDVIDFKYIEEDLEEAIKKFNVVDVPFDPWQATQLAQRMEAKGVPMVEFPATVRNFSEPMKEFEGLVRQGHLFHDGNMCFNWMIANLLVKEDRKGNIFPRKEREQNKIDGPVAAIMALARWIYHIQQNTQSVYENEKDEMVL